MELKTVSMGQENLAESESYRVYQRKNILLNRNLDSTNLFIFKNDLKTEII